MSEQGVVVIGGGFAGFWAAVAARRVGGSTLPVRLISAGPDLVMRPRLYEAAPESLAIGLSEPLSMIGVDFVLDRVVSVDPEERTVQRASGADIPYGSLVIATGSTMRRPPVPGAEGAYSVDDQASAIVFDRRLCDIAHQSTVRIAVVGAGFTGIELALELRARLVGHGRSDSAPSPEVHLVDRAPTVGAELGSGPRPVIEAALDAAGIVRRLDVAIQELGPTHIGLADGSIERFDAVVLCTGMIAAALPQPLRGATDAIGRHLVDAYLRHPDLDRIFVAGDVAAADTGTGHLALQSCQHALQMGRFAGENAARCLSGEELIPYHQPNYVTCLDLGDAGAVLTRGWDRTVVDQGPTAKALKQRINRQVIYPDLSRGPDGLLEQSRTTIS